MNRQPFAQNKNCTEVLIANLAGFKNPARF